MEADTTGNNMCCCETREETATHICQQHNEIMNLWDDIILRIAYTGSNCLRHTTKPLTKSMIPFLIT